MALAVPTVQTRNLSSVPHFSFSPRKPWIYLVWNTTTRTKDYISQPPLRPSGHVAQSWPIGGEQPCPARSLARAWPPRWPVSLLPPARGGERGEATHTGGAPWKLSREVGAWALRSPLRAGQACLLPACGCDPVPAGCGARRLDASWAAGPRPAGPGPAGLGGPGGGRSRVQLLGRPQGLPATSSCSLFPLFPRLGHVGPVYTMAYYGPGEGPSRCVGERAGPGANPGQEGREEGRTVREH